MDNPNPYQSTTECEAESPNQDSPSLLRLVIAGALWSLVSTFPVTALLALFFRFPVPFAGIDGGPSQVIPAMFALLFYGVLMGGFFLVGFCGGLAGAVAWLLASTSGHRRGLQRCLSIAVTFVLLFVLATLDWYIGPW